MKYSCTRLCTVCSLLASVHMMVLLDNTIPLIRPYVGVETLSQCTNALCVTGALWHLREAIRNQQLFATAHPLIFDLLKLQELSRRHITQVATFFKTTSTILQYGEMLSPISVEPASGKFHRPHSNAMLQSPALLYHRHDRQRGILQLTSRHC